MRAAAVHHGAAHRLFASRRDAGQLARARLDDGQDKPHSGVADELGVGQGAAEVSPGGEETRASLRPAASSEPLEVALGHGGDDGGGEGQLQALLPAG